MLREMAAKGMQPDGKGGQTFIPGGEKDPAVERQVANSRAAGAQTGKSDAIALEKLPNAIATGTELIRKLDALLGDAAVVEGKVLVPSKGIAPANGFENAFGVTGIAARNYPGSAAADFQAKVKEILGGAFLEAYETLRGAQGITDVEGKKATESRTRMSFDLSPAEFINAAREYRKTAAEALGRSETRLKSLKSSSAAPANRPSLDVIFATPEPQ
jgi:flagellar protein FlgJ